jgi:hypothetical protein
MMTRRIWVLLAILFAARGAAAEKTIHVPADAPTITKAIESAAGGDTVLVAPGSYSETVLVKDGVVFRSEKGAAETIISFPAQQDSTLAAGPKNDAVVTLQRCSNSTQVVGFTLDGRGAATRGILVMEGAPVIAECKIIGAANGLGSHRNAAPYLIDTRIEGSSLAALLVQGGSGDIRNCELVDGAKYGLVVEGTTKPLEVHDCRISGNQEAGVQGLEGDFTMTGGSITGNKNGLTIQYVSPVVQSVIIEGNGNIGVLLENSTGTIQGCTVRNNNFGCVISGTGDAKIFRNVFEDNPSYHVGVEGDAVPTIGGSVENANLFLGTTKAVVQSQCSREVNATYNYWGKPCASKDQIKVLPGAKDVLRKPWVTADLKTAFNSCEEARKHSRTPLTEGEAAEEEEETTTDSGAAGAGAGAGTGNN